MSFIRWIFNQDFKDLQNEFEVYKGLHDSLRKNVTRLQQDLDELKANQPLKVKYKNGMDKKADSTTMDKDNREATKSVPDSSSV